MPNLVPIGTKRLILRDWEISDTPSANEYARDPIVVRYMLWGPNTLNQTRGFILKARRQRIVKPRRAFELAVVLKSENRVIGGCAIRVVNPALAEGDLGYGFNRDYWGKGYATETVKALVTFGFTKLKLHRLWATCDNRNKGSIRVLEKAGLRFEGLKRENLFQKGRWRDTRLYAILEKDF
jgi:RimJ/RimL family protein N-acetyltransferase